MNIIKYYKFWLFVSATLLVAGVAFLIAFGLRLGIDFTGGTLMEIAFNEQAPHAQEITEAFASIGVADASAQSAGERTFLVKSKEISIEQHENLKRALDEKFGAFEEKRFESIGPVIGRELRGKAAWQLLLVSAGILLYIAYAFRKIRGLSRNRKTVTGLRMGTSAIIALVHDLFIVIGVFAVLGKLYGVEVDTLFVTALLTVLGFSVHDTIVVFDRIRENTRRDLASPLATIIERSIAQTIVRSINTSMTVIFVLIALYLFGDPSVRYFSLALLIGIVAGTYSSIFVASPILIVWHRLREETA